MFNNEKRIKIWKSLIIVDIVVIIIMVCFLYTKYINYKKANEKPNVFQFKNFKYELSQNVKFSNYDEYKFKIESDNWYAIIEPSIDKEKQIYNTDISYKLLKKYKYDVSEPKELMVGNTKVIVYEKFDTKTLLCYFLTEEEYGFEIEIYNNDGSFNTQSIYEIVNYLSNYEYDNSETYEYVIINLNTVEIDENGELVFKNDKS